MRTYEEIDAQRADAFERYRQASDANDEEKRLEILKELTALAHERMAKEIDDLQATARREQELL